MLSQPVGWVEQKPTINSRIRIELAASVLLDFYEILSETQHLTVRVLKHDIATDAVDENRKRLKS